MNWLSFALKLPVIIAEAMRIVQLIKNATGPEKKAAVLASIPSAVEMAEFGAGRDVLNDAVIAELMSVYIDAEKVAMKAKEALRAGILAKGATMPVPVVVP